MRNPARLAGSALISALFLIIVVAALGASMASLSTVEQDTSSKSLLSARVYYGAKTGLDWGIQRVISDPAPSARCTGSFPATFAPSGAGLVDVSVTVTCAFSRHGAATTSFTYFIQSTAIIGGAAGSLNYAERRMQATVSNIP